MQCPRCQNTSSKVIDTRPIEDNRAIRRRRECLNCGFRYSTYERIEQPTLLVIKRDGTRQEFDREKLLRGVIRSAEKRPISHEQMDELVSQVEESIRAKSDAEIESKEIGELVMPLLRQLDDIAYIRFASVYREFQTAESFMEELRAMDEKKHEAKDSQ